MSGPPRPRHDGGIAVHLSVCIFCLWRIFSRCLTLDLRGPVPRPARIRARTVIAADYEQPRLCACRVSPASPAGSRSIFIFSFFSLCFHRSSRDYTLQQHIRSCAQAAPITGAVSASRRLQHFFVLWPPSARRCSASLLQLTLSVPSFNHRHANDMCILFQIHFVMRNSRSDFAASTGAKASQLMITIKSRDRFPRDS